MNYTVTTRKKLPRNKYGDVATNSSVIVINGGGSSGSSSSGSSGGSSGGGSTQDLSNYVTKTELSSCGYLTSIPSQYVTDTELTATLQSYVTQSELEHFNETWYVSYSYLNDRLAQSSYVTTTVLNNRLSNYVDTTYVEQYVDDYDHDLWTSLGNNYLNKTQLHNELLSYVTWDGLQDMDFAFNDDVPDEWYNIHTEKQKTSNAGQYRLYTMIENYEGSKMEAAKVGTSSSTRVDCTKYRLVLMTFRRHRSKKKTDNVLSYRYSSRAWRVPMFSRRWNWSNPDGEIITNGVGERLVQYYDSTTGDNYECPSVFDWYSTWWTIWGNRNQWFWNYHKQITNQSNVPALLKSENSSKFVIRDDVATTSNPDGSIDGTNHRWRGLKNKKKLIGCAIYKFTGKGRTGWQRVSNISYVELFVNGNNEVVTNVRE